MESFYEAFINCEHRVLGKKLLPLSLRHCLYLEAIGSPYMDVINGLETQVYRRDLELAVLICSSNSDILGKLSRANFVQNWHMKLHPFKRNATRFLSYLGDYVSIPEIWDNGESGVNLNTPWILSRAAMLLAKTSMSRDEIWTMPIGELLWYCAALGEQDGVIQIQSDDEKSAIDEAIKIRENNG
nr:MAG TPA: hypothetical protein [Caudoviricetes sp.]